ncbi:transglycosylase-like protein with SLT domain [Rhodobacter aestuarii]|uniref:Transglycosylase SLT domain-containing protein n=1 Tax=Rhodobacter aestuarii TaxID=453582 RepID=A0A1N7PBT4_9RHOB|nr:MULTISPECIES: transglycosylase SLT domain-containing protein [Rhodobacter]PTV97728.1 transglycosylase-like protein with SLT domain [Rhodobacter aestuarii]SIT08103.1 Transglycosylase SLT domain-containing protein [Rhodobacter aestuarii]SOC04570.1 transglycosylase-like protein with SLT domain [Rhodobacter sp. JA431]
MPTTHIARFTQKVSAAALTLGLVLSSMPVAAQGPATQMMNGRPVLAWEVGHPERKIWSTRLRERIYKYLDKMGTPADIADYCPNFAELPRARRVDVWAQIAVTIAGQESDFVPGLVVPAKSPRGKDRAGLFQLTYGKSNKVCTYDPATASLTNPLESIDCAVSRMQSGVARDGLVAQGARSGEYRGIARTWKSMRIGKDSRKADVQAAVRALPFCG